MISTTTTAFRSRTQQDEASERPATDKAVVCVLMNFVLALVLVPVVPVSMLELFLGTLGFTVFQMLIFAIIWQKAHIRNMLMIFWTLLMLGNVMITLFVCWPAYSGIIDTIVSQGSLTTPELQDRQ